MIEKFFLNVLNITEIYWRSMFGGVLNSAFQTVTLNFILVLGKFDTITFLHSNLDDTFLAFNDDDRFCDSSYFVLRSNLLFPPIFHIWERKIFKSNGFFYKICQEFICLTLRVLPIEFNSNEFSFVRYVFVEIFGVF